MSLPAPVLILLSSFFFACMAVCVKLGSPLYGAGELVMYRGLIGVLIMVIVARVQGESLRTRYPGMHFGRCLAGVSALVFWFFAIGGLPLATAVTLNNMSAIWMSLFIVGGTVLMGGARIDVRLVFAVLVGFAGVVLVLQPTMARDQLWYGLLGLMSGIAAGLALLHLTALGRTGEPETRVVFYFSLASTVGGLGVALGSGGLHPHSLYGVLLLLGSGLFASAAQLLLTTAYKRGRPLVNASLQYTTIAYSFVFGVLLFDDPVSWKALAGMALIVAACLLATFLRQKVVAQSASATEMDA